MACQSDNNKTHSSAYGLLTCTGIALTEERGAHNQTETHFEGRCKTTPKEGNQEERKKRKIDCWTVEQHEGKD